LFHFKVLPPSLGVLSLRSHWLTELQAGAVKENYHLSKVGLWKEKGVLLITFLEEILFLHRGGKGN
jgi:hypothetical protein